MCSINDSLDLDISNIDIESRVESQEKRKEARMTQALNNLLIQLQKIIITSNLYFIYTLHIMFGTVQSSFSLKATISKSLLNCFHIYVFDIFSTQCWIQKFVMYNYCSVLPNWTQGEGWHPLERWIADSFLAETSEFHNNLN